ncbi:MAG: response regulator transcription factor [Haliscomenobacter sp.]|nr:response regulator transcription factor [Haliscomenobacter sp.]MBK9492672.1 response regulator transcription factor [Haliscomenobacter sp.]
MEPKIRVLIADDHQLVRKGFVSILEQIPQVEIVADAANGREVLDAFRRGIRADVVMLDYEMPLMNGLETLEQLKNDYFGIKVIMLTMLNERSIIQQAIEKGADGFLFKNTSIEELSGAIFKVHKGEKYFAGEVALALAKPAASIQNQALLELLSERELEILKLVAQGFSSTEIGQQLFISPRTVDTHRNNLIQKLEVKGIAGLVQLAIKNKLV